MRKMHRFLLLLVSLSLPALSQLPAFPGAQGFGSTTPGGRGGAIIEVLNLNNNGPGSFREACAAAGPRIVVFRTGGTIVLYTPVRIENPYLTIAGQSAPGGGICLSGAPLEIKTHDVIIRSLRFRPGDIPEGSDPLDRDGLLIRAFDSTPQNIIIDHCSISWGVDENASTWRQVRDVTFQWCIISEGLQNSIHPEGAHSMGLLIGRNLSKQISVHHTLFAHNYARNPVAQGATEVEVINNVVYNWGNRGTEIGEEQGIANSRANVIGNVYKPGVNTVNNQKGIFSKPGTGSLIYVKDNLGPGRPLNSGDDWLAVWGNTASRVNSPALTPSGISITPVEEAFDMVLDFAGALAPQRDAVDARVVGEVRSGSGQIIDSQNDVGGWPLLAAGIPLPDSDRDGMPDDWELLRGLNPNDPADGPGDLDGDGYTNVEEYLNSLIPWPPSFSSPPAVPGNLRVSGE